MNPHALDFSQFFTAYGYPLCAAIFVGLASWIAVRVHVFTTAHTAFLGAETQTKVAALEDQAINAGVNYLLNVIKANGGKFHPVVDNWLLRQSAQIAINHAAGILKDSGDDPNSVAGRILAKLPDTAISTDTTGMTIKPEIVEVHTLQPIGEKS